MITLNKPDDQFITESDSIKIFLAGSRKPR